MKLVKAIVRPNKGDAVKEALASCSAAGMTVSELSLIHISEPTRPY